MSIEDKKCSECGGTGLDHPESSKYRNTDDDRCPACNGTGVREEDNDRAE